jgi:transcriptional regulator with XRE-family HTH domain
VALDAGLSVPYVANLESGRGNPTLGALHALARALGMTAAELVQEGRAAAAAPVPASLARFIATPRFRGEVRRAAEETGADPSEVRRRFLQVMTAVAGALDRLDELDWHRVLDLMVLLERSH